MRIVLVLALAGVVAGCRGSGNRSQVVAAFYPLAFAAQAVGGPGLEVRNLTPSGAEPHDIELTPRDVAAVQQARLVLYLSHGFQPALEEAVRGAKGRRVDVLQGLTLRAGTGEEAGKLDPHVWLDPILFARIVRRVGDALGRPGRPTRWSPAELLDAAYRNGLRDCAHRDVRHEPCGVRLPRSPVRPAPGRDHGARSRGRAQRKAARLARAARTPLRDGTVFFERLVSPKLAETVAREAGARTAVLDPIEGLTPSESRSGATYLSLMRQNLAALRSTLRCR